MKLSASFKVDAEGNTNNWPDFNIWLGTEELKNGEDNVKFPAGKYILGKVWDFTVPYETVYSGGVTSKSNATIEP